MIRTVSILVFLGFCASIDQINAQDGCVPLDVVNLTISSDAILTWEVSPNETCEIEYFATLVQNTYGQIEQSYVTLFPYVHVSYLPPCDAWIFSVTAVSTDLISSGGNHLYAKTPMWPGTDLSLNITNTTHIDEYLVLEWKVANASNANCPDLYRITIFDETTNEFREEVTSDTAAYINNLSPCGRYEFSVRAIHFAVPETEGPLATFNYYSPARRPAVPRLEGITYGSTFFNSFWRPEDFSSNQCAITAVYVDGSPFFNITNRIQDTPSRTPFPVNVSSLLPNTLYLFRLSIQNIGGRSPSLSLAVQTERATTSEDNLSLTNRY